MDVSPLEAPTSVGKKFPFPVGKGQGERNCPQEYMLLMARNAKLGTPASVDVRYTLKRTLPANWKHRMEEAAYTITSLHQ